VEPVILYVEVLGHPSVTYRPAYARPAGGGLMRLLGPVPPGENWKYQPGEYVEYASQEIAPGKFELTVVRSASRDPEFQKRRRVYAICGIPFGIMLGVYCAIKIGIFSIGVYVVLSTIGAIGFSYASVRWGDRAWDVVLRSIAPRGGSGAGRWPF
jgi:hypothetical protein